MRKRFEVARWLLQLAAMGACALLAANAAGQLLLLSMLDAGAHEPHLNEPPPARPPSRSRDLDVIETRNIFCSSCSLIHTRARDPGANEEGNLYAYAVACPAPLQLVATWVPAQPEDGGALALVRDQASKAILVEVGDELYPGGVVARIQLPWPRAFPAVFHWSWREGPQLHRWRSSDSSLSTIKQIFVRTLVRKKYNSWCESRGRSSRY